MDLESQEQSSEAHTLMKQLNLHLERESKFLPKENGLNLIEAAVESENSVCSRLRDAVVEDLWSLTNFFGFSTKTFVRAVNLLDRFLSLMKVRPKYLSCVGIGCFHLAAKVTEEECDIPSTHDIIRISQCRCSLSDLKRMEKIISEKLHFEFKATTALTFLHLFYSITVCHVSESNRKDVFGFLSLDKLEAQLKACSCRLMFSKAKPSVLALSLLILEMEALKLIELVEVALRVQHYSKIPDSDLLYWRELVAKCLAEYSSTECCKPDNKKLLWIVSSRTAQNLQNCTFNIPVLPTIPEGSCFEESEGEDCYEDDSLSGSPAINRGSFFPEDHSFTNGVPFVFQY
ncbi:cyclin-G2 [Protopterus annectens]|uniref:cyclin-G2 n=1 Tax=Protopterus annectens TaxID=7888 RepID=UPI001CFBA1C7|nr:cyclin-G2 [Protopterus annectens]